MCASWKWNMLSYFYMKSFLSNCFPALRNWDVWRWSTASSSGLQSKRNYSSHFKVDFCWNLELILFNLAVFWKCAHTVAARFWDFGISVCDNSYWGTFPLAFVLDVCARVLRRVFRLAPESWRRWELSSVWPCWGWKGWRGCAITNTCWTWRAISLGRSLKWSG